jgi:diguanylate cyclase (GGDEF)-like protein
LRSIVAVLLLALALAARSDGARDIEHGARDFERGFPLIDVHEEREHKAGAQIFSLTQNRGGSLYFGTLAGVASYDGAWWHNAALPNESAVFSVASGKGPEIAVGGIDELGWAVETNGALTYHSLMPQLPKSAHRLGDVRSICAMRDGFLYIAENAVITWSGAAPRVIADLDGIEEPSRKCFRAGNTAYVVAGTGLQRLDGNRLVPAGFDGKIVDLVLPLDDSRLLVAVRDEGLFTASHSAVAPFAPEASRWLHKKTVVTGCRLLDGRMIVGTRQHGILVLGKDGTLEQQLDTNAGLPSEVLTAAITDREGALWLGYHGPFVRIDLTTPMSILDARRGLQGMTTSTERHRDALYATTSHGLFRADPASRMFHAIDGVPAPAWKAFSVDDELLIGTAEGVFVLDAQDRVYAVEGSKPFVVYGMARSQRDPSRIWMGTKSGVATLRRDGSTWKFERKVEGTPPYSRRVLEAADGSFWLGSIFDGVWRIDPNGTRIRKFGTGEMDVARVSGRIVAIGKGEILQPILDTPQNQLRPDPFLGHIHGRFFAIAEDGHGNVWTNGTPPSFVRKLEDGSYAREALPIVTIEAPRVQRMDSDDDGVMWAVGGQRLYRYETTAPPAQFLQPPPKIHRAVTGDHQQILSPLAHAFGRLRIEFGPVSYRPGTLYQYKLVPGDAAWSAWTPETSIDYTNLDHGDYTFHLRARGASGETSAETRWQFSVRPPWYRTKTALLLWGLLAALLIAWIVRLRTKALHRQADRLRELIDERTEDLRQANSHLERLALLDELTSIANRRYFQRALVEDWHSAFEHKRPLALLLLDLDHFKQLNDERGHPAGDAALVQVGRYLSRELRRSGELTMHTKDLVARIGGEEFAVLLTGTTEEDAARVGEKLRAGIEELQLGVTTSCGVAAIIPDAPEAWTILQAEADRALYAAKKAGRNCVKRASEEAAA